MSWLIPLGLGLGLQVLQSAPGLLNLHCNRSQALRLRLRLSWPHWQPLTIVHGIEPSSMELETGSGANWIHSVLACRGTLPYPVPSSSSSTLPLLLDLFLCCLAPPAAAEKINQDLHMLAYFSLYRRRWRRRRSISWHLSALSFASLCTIYFVIKYNHSA